MRITRTDQYIILTLETIHPLNKEDDQQVYKEKQAFLEKAKELGWKGTSFLEVPHQTLEHGDEYTLFIPHSKKDAMQKILAAMKPPSKRSQGILLYAQELLQNVEEEDLSTKKKMMQAILQWHPDWLSFSEAGRSLVLPLDIAKRLLTQAQIINHLHSDGSLKQPNSKETWLQFQARALFEAGNLLKKIYK